MPTSGATVETITFTRVAHIEIERRRPVSRSRGPSPPCAGPDVVLSESSRVELAHAAPHKVASPPPATCTMVSSAPVVAAAPRAGAGTTRRRGRAASDPVAGEPRGPSVVGRDTGGYLPFGAEQPDPVLDPGVRKQLNGLGVHVTLLVTVGEDGKTKSVAFQPALDAQTQTRIESLLADASWDPAVCGGGISCEGRATIRL